jgi:hypothetical protein
MNGALIVGNFGSECRVLAAYFPQGKAKVPFFKFCLGEAEADMIRERIHAGLKRAVDAGKTLGRPPFGIR